MMKSGSSKQSLSRFFCRSTIMFNFGSTHKKLRERRRTSSEVFKVWGPIASLFGILTEAPALTSIKEAVQKKYGKHINAESILVVVREIEGWYAAGIHSDAAAELDIDALATTDDLTKEQFNQSAPKRFGSSIVFKREVLKRFDIDTARRKNKSFAYFHRKYLQS